MSTTRNAIRKYYSANPNRDLILISNPISRELHSRLSDEIRSKKSQDSCTVFLTTGGGDPDGGYRMGRCLRHHYTHLRLVVPSYCKSAGTLIAIAADELAIGNLGELGPLDVQLRKPEEIAEQASGLDINEALLHIRKHAERAFEDMIFSIRFKARLSTKIAGEFASKFALGLTEPLYSQIDPSRLGEVQRAMKIAREYGERLNSNSQNLKHDSLNRLVAGYPSHGFVIDRKEARELFNRVFAPTFEEGLIINEFWALLSSEKSVKEVDGLQINPKPITDGPNLECDENNPYPVKDCTKENTISKPS